MSYQTGTATSPTDLLKTLVAWLAGLGWNTDLSETDGSGWRAHLDHNGNFVHLRAFANEGSSLPFTNNANSSGNAGIALYLSTAYSGSDAWNAQPGSPPYQSGSSTKVLGVGMALPSGAIQNYYFFADSTADNIVVVVEKTLGVYVHIGWGLSLAKCGAWTGGPYFFGTSQGYSASEVSTSNPSPGFLTSSDCPGTYGDWSSGTGDQNLYVRADVDSFTGAWLGNASNTTAAYGYTGKNAASPIRDLVTPPAFPWYANNGAAYSWQNSQTSALDGRANLLPVLIWAARDTSPGGYSPLGQVPNVFFSNAIGNGFSNAQEIALGSVTYKIFPNFAVVKQ
ncbi:MAG: hypothetical protein ACRD4R_06705 [Candidatus Acidiferrales bacterium]